MEVQQEKIECTSKRMSLIKSNILIFIDFLEMADTLRAYISNLMPYISYGSRGFQGREMMVSYIKQLID